MTEPAEASGTAPPTGPVRRPRDRKATIASVAADLFARQGFATVRLEDIAAASGITSRAVYRHYANKQALLSHIVNVSQGRYLAAFAPDPTEGSGGGSGPVGLPGRFSRLAAASLDSTHFAILWQREARHLDPEDHARLRSRLNEMAGLLVTQIAEHNPGLSSEQADVRAWAVLAILSSPGHHDAALARPAYDKLLAAACRTAVGLPGAPRGPAPTPLSGADPTTRASRREQLLAAAAALFRRAGYQAVSIKDIGAAAGIAGPAVYRYFDAKSDLLVALIDRQQGWEALESLRAVAASDADDPASVLGHLVAGHLRLAIEAPDLLAVTVTEWLDLPAGDAVRADRIRQDQQAVWVHWLRAARRSLGRPEARALVGVAMALIDDTVRVAHLLRSADLPGELEQLALRVLLDTAW